MDDGLPYGRERRRASSSKSQHIVTAELRLNVFGPPELIGVHFRTRKHLAVLLYLHFEGRARPVPRDRLVDLLWPDVPASQGRHSLSQALLAIRSHLGRDALTGREEEVQLLADLPADISGLHEGGRDIEPLRGLEDCGSAEFSHWVDGARVRLKTQARDLLRSALQATRAQGDAAATERLAATLYDLDPLCADAVYALAERALLDRDTVAAVRLLKQHVERARAELGSNPNVEIARLLRRLERGERPAVARRDERDKPRPFVGRDTELGRLEAIANRVVDGARPGYETCLISGPPGIGKTSLIRRFATSLQARAWPVFIVSCQEIGQGIPYAAVAELITALARDPGGGGTEPLWLAEASRVSPGLKAIYPGVPDAPDAPSDSIRLRVAEAVVHMIEAVADDGPVLLAFDDLQFVDPASQEVLFLATRALRGTDVSALILAGSRGGEASGGASGGGGLGWGTTVALQPLEQSHALSLLQGLSTEAEDTTAQVRETIVRLSQGNPYHIEMLLTDWRMHHANSLVAAASAGDAGRVSWTPPDDLRSAFARQYGGLSTDAQHVLQVLAVAGKAMAPREVATLLGLDGGVSERVVLEMLDRGVGRVEEGKLSFKNELHRTYVYHAMVNDRRTYHHAQLAQRLAESPDRHDLQVMLELVHHSIGAGLEPQAMEIGAAAAEAAIAHGAPQEAERVLTRLLHTYDVGPGSRLRLLLGQALVSAGHYQRALDALAEWHGDGAAEIDRALAALLRADALHRASFGSKEEVVGATLEAIDRAQRANATPFLVRANYIRMEICVDGADRAAWADAEALAAQIAGSDASPECVALANVTLGQSALHRGELALGVERFTAAAAPLEALGLVAELRRAKALVGLCYRGLGRVEDAIQALRETMVLADRTGQTGSIIHSRIILGNLYHDLAWFGAAVHCFHEILGPLSELASPRALVEANCDLARLAVVLGNMSEAEIAVAKCEAGARRSGLWRHRVTACLARAELHLCNGQPDLAWPLLEEAARVTGDRAHLLPDEGRFERLHHHFCWATGRKPAASSAQSRSLIDGLEVRLFDEAVSQASGAPVLAQAVALGLLGPLARLVASGVQHPAVPPRLEGESAAQLMARVYPHAQRSSIPAAIGLVAAT